MTITPNSIRKIINNSLVIEMDYLGLSGIETYRLVHILNFGKGQAIYNPNDWYFRFFHITGTSSMGLVRMVWRTGKLSNVQTLTPNGHKFRVPPIGFNPVDDKYIKIDTIWTPRQNP
jgi:hypothetical protein